MNGLRISLSLAILVLSLIFSTKLFSQQSRTAIDSLQRVLVSAPGDTSRIRTLNELVQEFRKADKPDSALKYCNEALRLSEKSGYKIGLSDAYADLGRINSDKENYRGAINNFQKALTLYEGLGDKKNAGDMYNLIANSYHLTGDFPNALKYQYAALKIREETGDEERVAWSYNNIATVYRIHGDLDESLKNFLLSLEILKKFDDPKTIAMAYNNIGNVYTLQGKYTDALKSYYSSLILREKSGDTKDIIASNMNIADSYCDLFEKDTITTAVTVEYANNISYTIPRTAWLDTAMRVHLKAQSMNEVLGNKYYTIFSLSGQGRINYIKKNYPGSIRLYKQAYAIAEELNALELQKEIAKYLSDNYNHLKDFQSGMEWYVKYEAHKDSLFDKLKTDDLTKTRMRHEYEKKENEAKALQDKKDALAKAELEKQKKMRNIFLGGFTLVLLFAGIFFYQRNNIRKEKVRSDDLLLNILPSEIASELKETGASKTKSFNEVTVLFADFVDFTITSEKLSPEALVQEIHTCFSAFDNILQKYRVEKIKTIGDAYLCAGGLPVSDPEHATQVVQAAIDMMDYIQQRKKVKEARNEIPFELRIGIHSGPVVAGIVGVKKYAYDIWGDTVNIAARMEQNSLPGKINISCTTHELIKEKFKCTYRGKIEAKNKGEIDMFFLDV